MVESEFARNNNITPTHILGFGQVIKMLIPLQLKFRPRSPSKFQPYIVWNLMDVRLDTLQCQFMFSNEVYTDNPHLLKTACGFSNRRHGSYFLLISTSRP